MAILRTPKLSDVGSVGEPFKAVIVIFGAGHFPQRRSRGQPISSEQWSVETGTYKSSAHHLPFEVLGPLFAGIPVTVFLGTSWARISLVAC